MSLIDPVDKSLAEKQADSVASIRGQVTALFDSMVAIHRHCMNMVWQNPSGLTPQEVLDGFQNRGTELFTLGAMLASLLEQLQVGSSTQPPSQYSVTFNNDGTVTITDTSIPTPTPTP